MQTDLARVRSRAAARGRYAPLHRQLLSLAGDHWSASFAEIEAILGFSLPDSARLYPSWWSNGARHSHALAWEAAGFRVRPRIAQEVALFERLATAPRAAAAEGPPWFDPDTLFAPWDPGPWPDGFEVSRDEIYREDGR